MSLSFFVADSEEVRYRSLCRDRIPVDGDSVFVLVLKRSCLKTILWGLSIRNSTLSRARFRLSLPCFYIKKVKRKQSPVIEPPYSLDEKIALF